MHDCIILLLCIKDRIYYPWHITTKYMQWIVSAVELRYYIIIVP